MDAGGVAGRLKNKQKSKGSRPCRQSLRRPPPPAIPGSSAGGSKAATGQITGSAQAATPLPGQAARVPYNHLARS